MHNRLYPNPETGPAEPGQLLVASAALEGTPFARTVVLVLQKSSDGVFGVILNRPADPRMVAEFRKTSKSPEHVARHLSCGGPLGGPVFAVHHDNQLGEIRISADLFVSASLESLDRLFREESQNYRVFLGIAGWKTEQLTREIGRGLWYPLENDSDDVIANPDRLWERSLIRYGRQQLCQLLHLPALPANAVWN